jgi:hypothetical protein
MDKLSEFIIYQKKIIERQNTLALIIPLLFIPIDFS